MYWLILNYYFFAGIRLHKQNNKLEFNFIRTTLLQYLNLFYRFLTWHWLLCWNHIWIWWCASGWWIVSSSQRQKCSMYILFHRHAHFYKLIWSLNWAGPAGIPLCARRNRWQSNSWRIRRLQLPQSTELGAWCPLYWCLCLCEMRIGSFGVIVKSWIKSYSGLH